MDAKKKVILILCFITVLLLVLLLLIPDRKEQSLSLEKEAEESLSPTLIYQEPPTERIPDVTSLDEKEEMPPTIYIIIDDVGYNVEQLEQFLDLPFPIAFSVLPHLPYTKEVVDRISMAQKELMIHIPMEPINGMDPGPEAIFTSMTDDEIAAKVGEYVEEVPAAVAANNHMGSKATGDERVMEIVLRNLELEGIQFIDSLTTSDSVVKAVSERLEIPYLYRNVFLDNVDDQESVISALQKGVEIATLHGKAVCIGHVWSNALPEILEQAADVIDEMDIAVGSIGDLVRETEKRNE